MTGSLVFLQRSTRSQCSKRRGSEDWKRGTGAEEGWWSPRRASQRCKWQLAPEDYFNGHTQLLLLLLSESVITPKSLPGRRLSLNLTLTLPDLTCLCFCNLHLKCDVRGVSR